MEKRKFGGTDMMVTPLSYGAMELRVPENHGAAPKILDAVLDCGINFIDTSQDYGASEELIGSCIAGRRHEYYLATKCGCNLAGGEHIFTRGHIIANLDDSLRKLRTDYIDLWQLHCVTPADLPGGAKDDVIAAMQDMRRAGKVRYIGVSYKNGKETDPAYPTGHQESYSLEMAGWGVFDSFQMVYGALTRISEKKIERIAQNGAGVIVRGVLKEYFPSYKELAQNARLSELFGPGEDLIDFLIRFAMSFPAASTMIVGSRSPKHIIANAAAAEKGPLPSDVYSEARRRLADAGAVPSDV